MRLLGAVLAVALCGLAETPQADKAKAAFDSEMTRAKAAAKDGDCPKAMTTLAINSCLQQELATSTANSEAYAAAIKVRLGSELAKGFDEGQAAWVKYREALCKSAYELYKGGTIAPSTEMSCQLMVLRSHMRELQNVYGDYLSR